jgi:hypothetical protein
LGKLRWAANTYSLMKLLFYSWIYKSSTYAISTYHHWCCEFDSRSGQGVQHYVIKFVNNLQQVCGFLWILQFPAPVKLTATI